MNIYETKDFYIGSILRTLGFTLHTLDRSQGNYVTFIFLDPHFKAGEVITQYWNRQIKVEARAMVEAINELKTRLHTKT